MADTIQDPTTRAATAADSRIWLVLGVLFFAAYFLGNLFPQAWWGTHHLAFLPGYFGYGILLVAISFLVFSPSLNRFWPQLPVVRWQGTYPLLCAVLATVVVCTLPEAFVVYGDGPKQLQSFAVDGLPIQEHWKLLFDPQIFHPKSGERTVLNLIYLISHYGEIEFNQAARVLGAICAFLFVFSGTYFIQVWLRSTAWRTVAYLIVLATPALQLCMGHFEIYAPALVVFSLYFMALIGFHKNRRLPLLLALLILQILALKCHSSAILFLPATILTVAVAIWKNSDRFQRLFTWKHVLLWLGIPGLLAFSAIYFLVLEDHVDPRWLEPDLPVYERLFLPIVSPEAPLDQYNLFSLNHLFDYVNMMFLWSPLALLLIIAAALRYRKAVRWNDPTVLLTGLTLLIFLAFFFMVNPLLSMPMDWDLFTMPAVVLMFFAIVLLKQLEEVRVPSMLLSVSLMLTLLCLPRFIVNASEDALPKRLEQVGLHVHDTYYIYSTDILYMSLELKETTLEERQIQLERILSVVNDQAIPPVDHTAAMMNLELGYHVQSTTQNWSLALPHFEHAWACYPELIPAGMAYARALQISNRTAEALPVYDRLLELPYANKREVMKRYIRALLVAKQSDQLLQILDEYVKLYPSDEAYLQVNQLCKQGRFQEARSILDQLNN